MFEETGVTAQVDGEEERKLRPDRFVNGLIRETINEWEWRPRIIKLIETGHGGEEDVKENWELLREPVLSYDERLLRYSDELENPVEAVHNDPNSSEEAIAAYDELARRYNELIAAPEPDSKQIAEVVKAACALYGSEVKDS